LRTLVDITEAAALQEPSALLFEDAHSADPTSEEVLDLLIDRVRAVPLMLRVAPGSSAPPIPPAARPLRCCMA
jgi:hypothetical protein